MKNDTSWDIFVSTMWKNQWTRQVAPISDEFKNSLYHESQGIADIAVKLYAMVQIRAIGLQTDMITPNDFHIVASEKLGLIKPALDALRSGDKQRISAIGDIAPISVEDYYAAYSAMLPPSDEISQKRNELSLSESAVLKLLELGVEPARAKQLVGKVIAEHFDLKKVTDIVRLAYQLFLSTTEFPDEETRQEEDLRNAAGYEDLKAGGAIGIKEW